MDWWVNSSISSIRHPVLDNTSNAAQAQNASLSSKVRSRRTPVIPSSAQTFALVGRYMTGMRSVCPPTVTVSPGVARLAAVSRPAATLRSSFAVRSRVGRTGRHSRVRWSMRALTASFSFLMLSSVALTGHGLPRGPSGGFFQRLRMTTPFGPTVLRRIPVNVATPTHIGGCDARLNTARHRTPRRCSDGEAGTVHSTDPARGEQL